jgi:hypothetical protein
MPGSDRSNAAPSRTLESRWQRFLATRYWLVLRNIIGWLLILAAFVAGPLVPGPGGIPLFLIGFALISFPGKRRLTARVLRGRPMRFRSGPFILISLGLALGLAAVVLPLARTRLRWASRMYERGPLAALALYLIVVSIIWTLARLTPGALNLLLRLIARARRRFRPWLRHRRIRLLPPRWRVRAGHERGSGPLRLKEEILKFGKKHTQQN